MANVSPYDYFDRVLDTVYRATPSSTGTTYTNVKYEYANSWATTANGDNYVLEATMVGIGKNDLKVSVVDNSLVVEGTPSVKSRYATAFKRSWDLAKDADVSRIDARLENGLLTVTIPKVKPAVRNIDVTVQ